MGDYKNTRGGLRLAAIKQVPDLEGYRWLTEPALRHLIFAADDRINSRGERVAGNGLGLALVRVGRRVLVDLDAFDQWLESHRVQLVVE
jgi:hypothetical protein